MGEGDIAMETDKAGCPRLPEIVSAGEVNSESESTGNGRNSVREQKEEKR